MKYFSILLVLLLCGCVSSSNQHVMGEEDIIPMTITNSTEIVEGYFITKPMMFKFIKIKRELDYYKELEKENLLNGL